MKIKNTKNFILITREIDKDKSKDFQDAFDTGVITLWVGKKSGKINGIKIWKNKENF